MKYIEFKNNLESGNDFPIYLFEGEDAFFRERGLSLIKNKYVLESEFDYAELENTCSANDLVATLNGYPLLSKKKVTLIKEFYPKADFIKGEFSKYLSNPSDLNVLVILNEKTSETLKKFPNVAVVECGKQDVNLIVKYIKAQCKASGVEIDAECASLIADYCLLDMTRVDSEVKKLISYATNIGVIDIATVNELVAKESEYKIYELTNFIGAKKFTKAIMVINELISKGETAHGIISYVYTYFRRLLHVSISNMDETEIAKSFKVKDYAIKKMKEQAKMFSKRSLKKTVDLLTEIDYKVKSGQADVDEKMWLVVFRIMTDK